MLISAHCRTRPKRPNTTFKVVSILARNHQHQLPPSSIQYEALDKAKAKILLALDKAAGAKRDKYNELPNTFHLLILGIGGGTAASLLTKPVLAHWAHKMGDAEWQSPVITMSVRLLRARTESVRL